MSPSVLTIRKYHHVRNQIKDGDLLLFRGTGLVSRLIRASGRGKYSHAAMAVWARSTLLCCEVREWHGGRAVTLSSQVQRCDIDVYHPSLPEHVAADAADCMLRKAGTRYGYLSVLNAGLLHLPFVRLCVSADTDDDSRDGSPEYCSEAVADCYRAAGSDPVPNLADKLTEPNDLARSAIFQYLWTLE